MIYLTGFIFSKSEQAFKYGLLVVMLITAFTMIFTIWSDAILTFIIYSNPFITAYYTISITVSNGNELPGKVSTY